MEGQFNLRSFVAIENSIVWAQGLEGADNAAMNEQTKTENERVGAECPVEQDGIKFVLEKVSIF